MKKNGLQNTIKKSIELHVKRQLRALFSEYSEKNLLNQLILQPENKNQPSCIYKSQEIYRLFTEFLSLPEENFYIYPTKISFKASLIPEYSFDIYNQSDNDEVSMRFIYALNEVQWVNI